MGVPTHVLEYSSGGATVKDGNSGLLQLLSPLRQLNGRERWYLALSPLPPGKDLKDVRGGAGTEFIQAAGSANALVVEIRKPGGQQWGATWVRYVLGHQHEGNPPLDVPIPLPDTTEMISAPEVFDAEEAGDVFFAYYKTGDIPSGYTLRPVEGYTADHELIDLRGTSAVR